VGAGSFCIISVALAIGIAVGGGCRGLAGLGVIRGVGMRGFPLLGSPDVPLCPPIHNQHPHILFQQGGKGVVVVVGHGLVRIMPNATS
jgi:hypothetical protein